LPLESDSPSVRRLISAFEESTIAGNEPGAKAQLESVAAAVYAEKSAAGASVIPTARMLQDEGNWTAAAGGLTAEDDGSYTFAGRGIKYLANTYLNQTFEFDWEYSFLGGRLAGVLHTIPASGYDYRPRGNQLYFPCEA
jgi:hypothetical protein